MLSQSEQPRSCRAGSPSKCEMWNGLNRPLIISIMQRSKQVNCTGHFNKLALLTVNLEFCFPQLLIASSVGPASAPAPLHIDLL